MIFGENKQYKAQNYECITNESLHICCIKITLSEHKDLWKPRIGPWHKKEQWYQHLKWEYWCCQIENMKKNSMRNKPVFHVNKLKKTWMSQAKKKKKNRLELGLQIWYQVANATEFYFLSCLFEHVLRGKRKELMGENCKLHSVLSWKWAIQIISLNFLVDVHSDLHIQEGLNFNEHQIHGLIRIYRTIQHICLRLLYLWLIHLLGLP